MPADEPTVRGGTDAERFDLDQLDDLGSAVDLDIVGDDGPTLPQRLGDWLDEHGAAAFVRRHRVAVSGVTALVVALAALGLWRWATRPIPLPEPPGVSATAADVGPELAELSPDGQATQVQQPVDLAVTEDRDVGLEVLGVSGPGLDDVQGLPVARVTDPDRRDAPVPARGALACGTTAQTVALADARDVDYRVVVRRSRGGMVAVDTIPLVGAQPLLDLVRSTCLQRLADRELRVTGVTITPGTDAIVTLQLAFQVEAVGPSAWPSVRVSPSARPSLEWRGAPLPVRPGSPTVLLGTLTPADCRTRTSGLEAGVLLSATPPGAPADQVDPPVLVPLPQDSVRALGAAVRALCGAGTATATVTSAIMRSGSAPGTGGTLDLDVAITAAGAFALELAESASSSGRLAPQLQVLDVVDGRAQVHVTWVMPPCAALVDAGLPRLTVSTTGQDGRLRPFLLPLAGEALGVTLNRMCPDIAPEIREPG